MSICAVRDGQRHPKGRCRWGATVVALRCDSPRVKKSLESRRGEICGATTGSSSRAEAAGYLASELAAERGDREKALPNPEER